MNQVLDNLPKPIKIIAVADMAIVAAVFFVFITNLAFYIVSMNGMSDLRNRVVGTRVAMLGDDPYFYSWKQGMPGRLADPYDPPEDNLSRLTVTPSILVTHLFFSNYEYARLIYFWIGLVLLSYLAIAYIFIKFEKKELKRLFIFLFFLAASLSDAFLHNITAGQLYLTYLLIALLAIKLVSLSKKKLDILAFFLIGILLSFRPQYIPVFLLLVIYKPKVKNIFSAIFGFLSSVFISIKYFGIQIWFSYFKAMQAQSQLAYEKFFKPYDFRNFYPYTVDKLVIIGKPHAFYDTSLKGIFLRLFNILVSTNILLVLAALFLLMFLVYLHKNRQKLNIYTLITASLFGVLLLEILTPAPRYNYNNIILMPLSTSILFFYKKCTVLERFLFFIFVILGGFLSIYDNPAKIIYLIVFIPVSILFINKELSQK